MSRSAILGPCILCLQPVNTVNSDFQNEENYRDVIFECCKRLLYNNVIQKSLKSDLKILCQKCFTDAEKLWTLEEMARRANCPAELPPSCKLCYDSFANTDSICNNDSSEDGYDDVTDVTYKHIIFNCCNRLLNENVKGDSFIWIYSTKSRSPFCFECFLPSEKLWQIDQRCTNTKEELYSFIDSFSTIILHCRLNNLHKKTGSSTNRIREVPHIIALGNDSNKNMDKSITGNCGSNLEATRRNQIIIETFKKEPPDSDDQTDTSHFDIIECEPEFEDHLLETLISDVDQLGNDRVVKNTVTGGEHLMKPVILKDLIVSIERLRFDSKGNVIVPESETKRKRKAAVKAAVLLHSASENQDTKSRMVTRNRGYSDDEFSDFGSDLQRDDSDSDESDLSPVEKSRTPFKRRKMSSVYRRRKIGWTLFKCAKCNSKFRLSKDLDLHSEESGHVNERLFSCTVGECDKKYYTTFALHQHIKKHRLTHSSKTKTCKHCGKVSETFNELKAHLNAHNLGNFRCNLCDETHSHKDDLMEHMGKHTGEANFKCDLCPAAFLSRRGLLKHKTAHKMKNNAQCTTCHNFYKDDFLSQHMKIHLEENKKRCNSCEMSFEYTTQLIYHKVTMHGAKLPFTCRIESCTKSFISRKEIDYHVKVVHKKKSCDEDPNKRNKGPPYICDVDGCDKSYQHLPSLCRHRDKEHPSEDYYLSKKGTKTVLSKHGRKTPGLITKQERRDRYFKCSECDSQFKFSRNLDVHSKESGHVNERTFICTIEKCDKKYRRKLTLMRHKLTHSEKVCKICRHESSNSNEHNEHMKTHNLPKLSCNFCDYTCVYQDALKEHMFKHTGEATFKCTLCPAAFLSRRRLYDHRTAHKRQNKFQCFTCNMFYKTEAALTQHIKIHLEENQKKCNSCEMSFDSTRQLIFHKISVHKAALPYTCGVESCKKSFICRKDVNYHAKVVHGDKDVPISGNEGPPYICGMDACDKSYQHLPSLHNHRKKVHSSYLYEKGLQVVQVKRRKRTWKAKKGQFLCPHCGKIFTMSSYLTVHIKVSHTNEAVYACENCSKTFSRADALRRHLKIHQGELHDCHICGRGFTVKTNMKMHIKRVHEQNKKLRKSYTRTIGGPTKDPVILDAGYTEKAKDEDTKQLSNSGVAYLEKYLGL